MHFQYRPGKRRQWHVLLWDACTVCLEGKWCHCNLDGCLCSPHLFPCLLCCLLCSFFCCSLCVNLGLVAAESCKAATSSSSSRMSNSTSEDALPSDNAQCVQQAWLNCAAIHTHIVAGCVFCLDRHAYVHTRHNVLPVTGRPLQRLLCPHQVYHYQSLGGLNFCPSAASCTTIAGQCHCNCGNTYTTSVFQHTLCVSHTLAESDREHALYRQRLFTADVPSTASSSCLSLSCSAALNSSSVSFDALVAAFMSSALALHAASLAASSAASSAALRLISSPSAWLAALWVHGGVGDSGFIWRQQRSMRA